MWYKNELSHIVGIFMKTYFYYFILTSSINLFWQIGCCERCSLLLQFMFKCINTWLRDKPNDDISIDMAAEMQP